MSPVCSLDREFSRKKRQLSSCSKDSQRYIANALKLYLIEVGLSFWFEKDRLSLAQLIPQVALLYIESFNSRARETQLQFFYLPCLDALRHERI